MVIAVWFMHVRKPQSSGLGGCLVMEKSVHDTGFFFSKVYGWSLNKRPTSFRKEFVNATDDSCPFLFSSLQAKHQVLGNTYTWLWKIRQNRYLWNKTFLWNPQDNYRANLPLLSICTAVLVKFEWLEWHKVSCKRTLTLTPRQGRKQLDYPNL